MNEYKSNVIISPIFYMGNKKKLISKGLVDLFPQNINTFVDVFAGSSVVSMNTNAKHYIINDINSHLIELYGVFQTYTPDVIVEWVENRIEEYGLARERTRRCQFFDTEKLKQYKTAYVNLRNYYNQTKSALDFYTLMFYSFSQQFRFNGKGEFNMPYGNDCFSEKNKEYIYNGANFFSKPNMSISCCDFRNIDYSVLNTEDFVYFDPPYYNTIAIYTENDGWTETDEKDLRALCDSLTNRGIKFALSNVFVNKSIVNESLINWVNDKSYNVFMFDKFSYTACGKGNSNAKEVLITNY